MSMRVGFPMIETGICWWSKSRSHKHVLDSLFVCVSFWRNAYFIAWWYKREKEDQITCCYPLLINTATQHNDHCMIPCQIPTQWELSKLCSSMQWPKRLCTCQPSGKSYTSLQQDGLRSSKEKKLHMQSDHRKKKVNWDSLQCSTTNLVACFKLPSHRSG